MKIALIADIDISIKKGLTNYVQTKAHVLNSMKGEGIDVDYFIVRAITTRFYSFLRRIPRRTISCDSDDYIKEGDIRYKVIYVKRGLLHAVLTKLFPKCNFDNWQLSKIANYFKDYDGIESHWILGHYLALAINKKYNIPYTTTWHGSDINLYALAQNIPYRKKKVSDIFEHAAMNFFVSKALTSVANTVSQKGNKTHVYTGASNAFYKYADEKKAELRTYYNVRGGQKVIAFSGNVIPMKNVLSLPGIFKRIQNVLSDKVIFWIIGDGEQLNTLKQHMDDIDINYRLFGNVAPSFMPDIMNCIDVLVAPSLNEGISLVLQEIRACGGFGVGSKVGGIPEAVGDKNSFDLGPCFEKNIAERIIEIIKNDEHMEPLSDEYSWEFAVKKELDILANSKDK